MADLSFGPLVTGTQVEQAALETLQLWTPEYLAWVARQTDREPGSLIQPRSWTISTDTERWPEEQLPSVMLVSTGLTDEPSRDGKGEYTARFALALAVTVSAKDAASTDALCKLYTAALRAILVQHQSLGGLADAVEWVDEQYDVLSDTRNKRQLAMGQVIFRVQVGGVVSGKTGPMVPREDPLPPYPDTLAEMVEAEVEATEEP